MTGHSDTGSSLWWFSGTLDNNPTIRFSQRLRQSLAWTEGPPGSGGQPEGREGSRPPTLPSAPSWTSACWAWKPRPCEDLAPPPVSAGGLGRGSPDCTLPKARPQRILQDPGRSAGWAWEEPPVGGRAGRGVGGCRPSCAVCLASDSLFGDVFWMGLFRAALL